MHAEGRKSDDARIAPLTRGGRAFSSPWDAQTATRRHV
jgi:hypothetical protein